jgi:hypothetical protein
VPAESGAVLSVAELILSASPQWHHLADRRRPAETSPIRHQPASLLEQIAAAIGSFHLVPDRMVERHFEHFAGAGDALRPNRKT